MNDRNERNREERVGREWHTEGTGWRHRGDYEGRGEERGEFSRAYDRPIGGHVQGGREPSYDEGDRGFYQRPIFGDGSGSERGGYGDSQRGRGYSGGGDVGVYGGDDVGGRDWGDYFGGVRDQGYSGRDLGHRSASSIRSRYSGGYGMGGGPGRGELGGATDTQRGGYAGRGPKGYTRTDERIREEVCERRPSQLVHRRR